jgi:hypothetical protein
MNNPDIFDVFDGDIIFDSSYIPLISFHNQDQKEIAEIYIQKEADDFFENILKIDPLPQCIPYYKTINCQDFTKVKIEYFYETLFFDLCERDSSGKLISNLKWGVTFDAEIAPITTAYMNPLSSRNEEAKLSYLDIRKNRPSIHYPTQNSSPLYRRYGVITLNEEAVFYYLYFTMQEILDAIKQY